MTRPLKGLARKAEARGCGVETEWSDKGQVTEWPVNDGIDLASVEGVEGGGTTWEQGGGEMW